MLVVPLHAPMKEPGDRQVELEYGCEHCTVNNMQHQILDRREAELWN